MSKRKKKIERDITWNTLPERINKVREKILSAGNTIGAVVFEKRTDETLRRMSFRLHARKSLCHASRTKKTKKTISTREKDLKNLQLTVLDVNKTIRDSEGNKIRKSLYRVIPLELVQKISVRGITYTVQSDKRRNLKRRESSYIESIIESHINPTYIPY